MLKRFRVSNFKSLLNVEFKPVGLNLLIGPNNSGKTNLCSALRFLSRTSFEPLEVAAKNAIGETWSIPNVYVSDSPTEFEMECSMAFGEDEFDYRYVLKIEANKYRSWPGGGPHVAEESLTVNGGRFNNTPMLMNKSGQSRLFKEEPSERDPSSGRYVDSDVPSDATVLSLLQPGVLANFHATVFRTYLRFWSYYNLDPISMRTPGVVRDIRGLVSDGRNLSQVFYELHNSNPRLEKRIIDVVKELESKLDFFVYQTPDPESVYLSVEDEKRNHFGVQSISDGTLRFMALTYLVLTAAEMSLPYRPLIIIEEPENGLYVGHLKPLIERIDPSGERGQFIFTTHSPYFIDLFDGNLDGLHLMKPGRPSSVLVKPDPQKISAMLEKMPLGEMHFREMLG